MIRPAVSAALVLALAGPALADPALAQSPPERNAPAARPLDNPSAFEHGFAVSLYQFDACGDPLAGRWFRQALSERFAQCPFTAEARAQFARRTRAEQVKARQKMQSMIEANGGLPRELDGMSTTCHQQQISDSYRAFRSRLEQYEKGARPAETIVPAPCDAADILP